MIIIKNKESILLALNKRGILDGKGLLVVLCHTGYPKYRNSYNYCVVQSYHTTPGLMIIHYFYIKTSISDQ